MFGGNLSPKLSESGIANVYTMKCVASNSSAANAGIALLYIESSFLVLLNVILAARVRNVADQFNESKTLGIAIFTFVCSK